uniref:RING finger protein 17 n=1 Tax=Melopsittacus undulatus TaxID=13146 RepID=A0A8C6IY05_MELUD
MAAIYKEFQPQAVKWESGMHCAVYLHDLQQWQRGQISRIVSETSAEVMLYDSGAEKTVDIHCLRKLEESMKIIRTLAIECSLADIRDYNLFSVRPTDGSAQWTATACECLSYYLTGAEVKMVIQVCIYRISESSGACALPVKILCKDETGEWVDISEHLIKKGLASRSRRTDKADVACSVSKEHLKVCLKQEGTGLDSCSSRTVCARSSPAPEESITVLEHEQIPCKTYNSLLHSGIDEVYKSPVIPEAKIFQAIVSSVGYDGTIYIIPKTSEIELSQLMTEIQNKFRCLGLLEPYCWKKGEACVVRGSDTIWYRGKIVEPCGSTLQVQYVDHGCIERIPQCHLYPTTLYTDIPPFCIPCQLYKTIPVSKGKLRGLNANCDSELESLDEALRWCNKSVKSFPLLTHFQTEMPCLVEYQDGLWYRGKLLSLMKSDPVKILVQFVDYGTNTFHFCFRLRQIPCHLLKYPVQAVRVLLAGFKPALYDRNVERIPYSPEWSVDALWAMMGCIEGKQLSASIALAPEVTISLYEDNKSLVHMKLIEMGLADLDE